MVFGRLRELYLAKNGTSDLAIISDELKLKVISISTVMQISQRKHLFVGFVVWIECDLGYSRLPDIPQKL